MQRSSYYLSKHTFFCLADDHYVFLDLRNDEYLCLGRAHTNAIKSLQNGHPVFDESSTGIWLQDSDNSDTSAVIQALLQKELLVCKETHGKRPTPVQVETPLASMKVGSEKPRPVIGPAHVWNFFFAAAAASKSLRWNSIEHTVRKVENRKSARIAAAAAVDNDVVTDMFDIFQTLRPYYPRSYLCLFDSLALLHFLARYDVFPQWVYGVRLEPFHAHCWVQAGDLVINDIIDNVRDYTPIMCI